MAASPYIPVHVMFDILARLPAKSLLRFKCVCKEWYDLINSSPFIQHHLTKVMEIDSHLHDSLFIFTRREFLYFGENIESPSQVVKLNLVPENYVRVIGTCNGLVCLEIGDNKGFIIFNPLTRIFKLVLCNCPVMNYFNRCIQYGFGYDSQHADYKIVIIMLGEVRDIWIYSLNSNSWRTTTTTTSSQPPQPQPLQKKFYVPQCPIVYRNGMLHCVLRGADDIYQVNLDFEGSLMDEDNKQLRIARFNLSTEEWDDEDLGFPNIHPDYEVILRVYSTFLNGCFCLSLLNLTFIDIWIMKESWTKLCRVPRHNEELISLQCPPIAYSRTRSEALLFRYAKHPSLVWYDLKYETLKLYEGGIDSGYIGYVNLTEGTLVSIPEGQRAPKAYVEEDKLYKRTDNNLSTLPKKLEKKKKKEKRILYYSWSTTS